MSEQNLNVRFSASSKCPVLGRPPGRPYRCGHSFQRGRCMPEENLAGAEGRASPMFLSAVAAVKLAGKRYSTASLGRGTRIRPRQAQPRDRRSGAHLLLAAGGLG